MSITSTLFLNLLQTIAIADVRCSAAVLDSLCKSEERCLASRSRCAEGGLLHLVHTQQIGVNDGYRVSEILLQ